MRDVLKLGILKFCKQNKKVIWLSKSSYVLRSGKRLVIHVFCFIFLRQCAMFKMLIWTSISSVFLIQNQRRDLCLYDSSRKSKYLEFMPRFNVNTDYLAIMCLVSLITAWIVSLNWWHLSLQMSVNIHILACYLFNRTFIFEWHMIWPSKQEAHGLQALQIG